MAIVKYTRDPWRALETMHDELTGLLSLPPGSFPVLGRPLSLTLPKKEAEKEQQVKIRVE